MSDSLSSYFLQLHGWERKGGKYFREGNVVEYDGVKWFYNGKEIPDSVSDNPQLKIPQLNFHGFKDEKDYYERLMENK